MTSEIIAFPVATRLSAYQINLIRSSLLAAEAELNLVHRRTGIDDFADALTKVRAAIDVLDRARPVEV